MAPRRRASGLATWLCAAILLPAAAAPVAAECGGSGYRLCRDPDLLLARSEAGHVYGAIAYSRQTGAFGFATRFGDSDSANALALGNCAKRGPGCYVVISFSNLCASVSADNRDGVFWGTAGTRTEAQRQSQLHCNRDGGDECKVVAWACSFP